VGPIVRRVTEMVTADRALPGSVGAMPTARALPAACHRVLGTWITPPFADGLTRAAFATGRVWGAERTGPLSQSGVG